MKTWIQDLVEKLKTEHLIYHDPHMVKRVVELIEEAFTAPEVPEQPEEQSEDNA